jgi:hypothetical protein
MSTKKPRKLFTLSEDDVRKLAALSEKLGKPEAFVVRMALRSMAKAHGIE